MKKLAVFLILVMAVILIPMSAFAAERYEILKLGDRDESGDKYVYDLQKALKEKGYFNVKPTGYYGNITQNAVIAFQRDEGIRVDGKAGPEVRKHLFGSDYEPIPSSRHIGGGTSSVKVDNMELRSGDKGNAVSDLQSALKKYGYYSYDKITGYFGPITEEAVKKFQRSNGFRESGVMHDKELDLLLNGSPKYYVMSRGDKGDDIEILQQRLNALGFMDTSPTGFFGKKTEDAVKAFQKANSLKVDGRVGKETRGVLYSDSAQKDRENQGTSGGNTAPAPTPSPSKGALGSSSGDSDMVTKFINLAKTMLNKPYVYATEGPETFDCSGLVYYCLKNIGYKISRMSSRGYAALSSWKDVKDKSDLRKGDLVFFRSSSGDTITHIAIYIGGGQILHAIPSEGCVYISTFTGYWDKYFVSAKRINF